MRDKAEYHTSAFLTTPVEEFRGGVSLYMGMAFPISLSLIWSAMKRDIYRVWPIAPPQK